MIDGKLGGAMWHHVKGYLFKILWSPRGSNPRPPRIWQSLGKGHPIGTPMGGS
jgi:hypothetical protein